MKAFQYIFIVILFGTVLLSGCANSDDVATPEIHFHEATATITLEELYDKATTEIQQYTDNDILEAYVSSSDEGGTFYKSVSLQNREGTLGFSIPVDMYNINTYMNPGRKVYIYLQDFYFAVNHSSLVIGGLYQENNVGRMRPQDFYKKVFPSKEVVSEEELKQNVTLAQLRNNSYINILVEIENVQFDDNAVGKPFYDPNSFNIGGATNHRMTDATTTTMIFRTSAYASFASRIVPPNSGSIRGVLTKYNNDFQFMARTFNDLKLDQPRNRESTVIGGDDMIFNTTINEDFESFTVSSSNQTSFPQYGNDYSYGERYWAVRSFDNNKYIQLTSFGNNTLTKSYFIVPVQFNGNNTLSFKTKDGYYNGNVLNVYFVTADDYIYGEFIDPITNGFTNITSQFVYSTGTTNGYADTFVASGIYSFPNNITGNGYVVFEYSGSETVTTTIQIDDIKFE